MENNPGNVSGVMNSKEITIHMSSEDMKALYETTIEELKAVIAEKNNTISEKNNTI